MPKGDITSEFLVSVMHSTELLAFAIKTTSGLNHPRTSWNSLKEYRFGLPKKDEQDEIARVMLTFETKILNGERKRAILEDLLRTLLFQLMTGQIRVDEIDLPGLS